MFVITIDRRNSRAHNDDLIEATRSELDARWNQSWSIPIARFAGDELQLVTDDAVAVIDIALYLTRNGDWSVGIGHGTGQLTATPGASTGDAFFAARAAVTRAKRSREHVGVDGADPRLRDVEAVLALLIDLRARRTAQGWEVADLLSPLTTQRAVATALNVTASAVSERAATAGLKIEQAGVAAAARMLGAVANNATMSGARDTLPA